MPHLASGGPVVIVGAEGTLSRLSEKLVRRGWRVLHAEVIRRVAVRAGSPPGWLRRDPPPDVWVVTSRAVVTEFWRCNSSWRRYLRRIPTVLAIGPGTARALRSVGLHARNPRVPKGTESIPGMMGWWKNRVVVYLRSERAGPELARSLRRRGARVWERVAYRTTSSLRMSSEERQIIEQARAWVVGSPSALRALRRALGRSRFQRAVHRVELIAMGRRTAIEARRLGARRPKYPSASTEEDLTKLVANVLGRAGR